MYDDNHPGLLASAIGENLQQSSPPSDKDVQPRAVVMVPLRDSATERLKGEFVTMMAQGGLAVVEEDMLEGEDDWDNGGAVRCWLGIFGRTV